MKLILKAIDTDQQTRNFICWFPDIESCFDLLNELKKRGNQLLRIELVDNDKRLIMPVEAFDGESFSVSIQNLKLEWEHLLNR